MYQPPTGQMPMQQVPMQQYPAQQVYREPAGGALELASQN
jgi:hypothetical protein